MNISQDTDKTVTTIGENIPLDNDTDNDTLPNISTLNKLISLYNNSKIFTTHIDMDNILLAIHYVQNQAMAHKR